MVTYYLWPLDQSPYYYAIPLIIAVCSVFLYELYQTEIIIKIIQCVLAIDNFNNTADLTRACIRFHINS